MATLTFEQSKHLVERTGVGAELEIIETLSRMNKHQAVDYLLKAPRNYLTPIPHFSSFEDLQKLRKKKTAQSRMKVNKIIRQQRGQLKKWAVSQLLKNPNPLQERMTWFWHNHFTSSILKSSRTLDLTKNQTLLIRNHAMGNFANLLKDIAYDPLMLVYLDGISNKKGKPNENFARELLELFTIGEGNYTDQDVKEVARAFTGWRVNKLMKATLTKRQHDNGTKVILGKSGRFNSDDVLDILLMHPKTAEFVATKFWKEFISTESPDKKVITKWANIFRTNNYDITILLREVLSSDAFWDVKHKGGLIKSPIDIVIGSLRALDLEDKNIPLQSLSVQLKKMGQDLYMPPNVKGWIGGETWVTGATLPLRQQFLQRLTRGSKNQATSDNMMQSTQMMQSNKMNSMPSVGKLQLPMSKWESWLLPLPAIVPSTSKQPQLRLRAILLDPAYQLK